MTDLDDSYCPECGDELAGAYALHAEDDSIPPYLSEVFEPERTHENGDSDPDKHLKLNEREVRVYVHDPEGST